MKISFSILFLLLFLTVAPSYSLDKHYHPLHSFLKISLSSSSFPIYITTSASSLETFTFLLISQYFSIPYSVCVSLSHSVYFFFFFCFLYKVSLPFLSFSLSLTAPSLVEALTPLLKNKIKSLSHAPYWSVCIFFSRCQCFSLALSHLLSC